ncbi:hypothetical protein ACNO7T_15775 [Vibrio campbellii]
MVLGGNRKTVIGGFEVEYELLCAYDAMKLLTEFGKELGKVADIEGKDILPLIKLLTRQDLLPTFKLLLENLKINGKAVDFDSFSGNYGLLLDILRETIQTNFLDAVAVESFNASKKTTSAPTPIGRQLEKYAKRNEETQFVDLIFFMVSASQHCSETLSTLKYKYNLRDFMMLKNHVGIYDAIHQEALDISRSKTKNPRSR